jgi:PAS domain S-box-containing protein
MVNQSNVGQPLVQASLIGEAIDGGPMAVFVADEEMRLVAVNGYAAELLGYAREELLELTVVELSADADVDERFGRLARRGERVDGRTALLAKDGRVVRFERRSQATSIAGMTLYVWVGWPLDEPVSGTTPAPGHRSARASG